MHAFYFVINLRGAPVSNRQRFIFETRLRAVRGDYQKRLEMNFCRHSLVARAASASICHWACDVWKSLFEKKNKDTHFLKVGIGRERIARGRARAARRLGRVDWPAPLKKLLSWYIQGDVHSIYKVKLGERRAPHAPTWTSYSMLLGQPMKRD
jgi:hypothetical protein